MTYQLSYAWACIASSTQLLKNVDFFSSGSFWTVCLLSIFMKSWSRSEAKGLRLAFLRIRVHYFSYHKRYCPRGFLGNGAKYWFICFVETFAFSCSVATRRSCRAGWITFRMLVLQNFNNLQKGWSEPFRTSAFSVFWQAEVSGSMNRFIVLKDRSLSRMRLSNGIGRWL